MKLNKLLFLFFALIAFSSCTEYVDYGVVPETPNYGDFKAKLSSTEAKYIGDTFEFEATMSGADVTIATDFKINGTLIDGYKYIPQKEGEYSVTASFELPGMPTKTSTFKFNVLKKANTSK